ncbi:unnamed protein product, partial [marine sediment metagenome]
TLLIAINNKIASLQNKIAKLQAKKTAVERLNEN